MCAAVAMFACLDTTAKYLNTRIDPLQIAWARYTSAFLLTLLVSNPWTQPGLMRTNAPKLQIVRCVLLVGFHRAQLRGAALAAARRGAVDHLHLPLHRRHRLHPAARRMDRLAALVGDSVRLCRRAPDHAARFRRHASGGAVLARRHHLLRALRRDHAHRLAHRFQPDLAVLQQFRRRPGHAAGPPLRLAHAGRLADRLADGGHRRAWAASGISV